jgi:hypothetical protein
MALVPASSSSASSASNKSDESSPDLFSVALSILLLIHPKSLEGDLEYRAHCFVDASLQRDVGIKQIKCITAVAPVLFRKPDNGVAFTTEWAKLQKTDHMREHSYIEYRRSIDSISDPHIFFAPDPDKTFVANILEDTEVYLGGNDRHSDDEKCIIRILEGTQVPIAALRIPLKQESSDHPPEIVSFDASLYESFLKDMRKGGIAKVKRIPDGGFFGNGDLENAIDVRVQANTIDGTNSLVKKGGDLVLVKDCTKPWLDRYLVSSGPPGVETAFTSSRYADVLRWEIKAVDKKNNVPANWWAPRVSDLIEAGIQIDSILHARQITGFTYLSLDLFDYIRLREQLVESSEKNTYDRIEIEKSVFVSTNVGTNIYESLLLSNGKISPPSPLNKSPYYVLDIKHASSGDDVRKSLQSIVSSDTYRLHSDTPTLLQGYLTGNDITVSKYVVKIIPSKSNSKIGYWFPKWATNRRYKLNSVYHKSSVVDVRRVVSWMHSPSYLDGGVNSDIVTKTKTNNANDDDEEEDDTINDTESIDDEPVFVVPIESISLYSVLSDDNVSSKQPKRFSGDLLIGSVSRSSPVEILNSMLTPSMRASSRTDKVGFALWRARALRCFESLASDSIKSLDKAVEDVMERREELKERMLHRNLDKTMTFEEFEQRIIVAVRMRFIPDIVACMGAIVLMVDNDTKKVHANAKTLLRTYFAMVGENIDKILGDSLSAAYKRCTDDPTLRMAARSWNVSIDGSITQQQQQQQQKTNTICIDKLLYSISDNPNAFLTKNINGVYNGSMKVIKFLGDSDKIVSIDQIVKPYDEIITDTKAPIKKTSNMTFDEFIRQLGSLKWGEGSSSLVTEMVALSKSDKGKAPAMWVKTMEMGSSRRTSFLEIFSSASGPQSARRMIAPDKALLKDILMFIRGTIVPIILRGPSDESVKKILPSMNRESSPVISKIKSANNSLSRDLAPLVDRDILAQIEQMGKEMPEYAGTCSTLCMNIVMEVCLRMAENDMKLVAIAMLKIWEYLTIFNRQDSQKDDEAAYAAERERVKRKKMAVMKGLLSVVTDVDDEMGKEFRALHGKKALKDIDLDDIYDINDDEMHSSLTTRSNEHETYNEGEMDARDMYWGGDASDEGLSDNLYQD